MKNQEIADKLHWFHHLGSHEEMHRPSSLILVDMMERYIDSLERNDDIIATDNGKKTDRITELERDLKKARKTIQWMMTDKDRVLRFVARNPGQNHRMILTALGRRVKSALVKVHITDGYLIWRDYGFHLTQDGRDYLRRNRR